MRRPVIAAKVSKQSTFETNNNNNSGMSFAVAAEEEINRLTLSLSSAPKIKTEEEILSSPTSSMSKKISTTIPTKRRSQVKNACVNCQKACKKCDEGRPCQRCIKLGLTTTCRDSDRKERKKGFKRGPYRKKSVTPQQHIIPKKKDLSTYLVYPPPTATAITTTSKKSVMRKKREPKLRLNTTATNNVSTTTDWSSISSHSNHESPSRFESGHHKTSIENGAAFYYNNSHITSLPPNVIAADSHHFHYAAIGVNNSSGAGPYPQHQNNTAQNYPSIVNNNNTQTIIGSNIYYGNDDLFPNDLYQSPHSRNSSFDSCFQQFLPTQSAAATMGMGDTYMSNNSYYYNASNVSSSPPELDDLHAYMQQPNTAAATSFDYVGIHGSSYPTMHYALASSAHSSTFFNTAPNKMENNNSFSNNVMMFDHQQQQQWAKSVPKPYQ